MNRSEGSGGTGEKELWEERRDSMCKGPEVRGEPGLSEEELEGVRGVPGGGKARDEMSLGGARGPF